MKKLILVIIVMLCLIIITPKNDGINRNKKEEEMRAIFISYLELNTYIRDKNNITAKNNIKKMINNVKDNNFNTIILQVRSHDDAIYKSKYFKVSSSIILKDKTNFDVLDYFIKICDSKKINIYIWINPFRITRPNEEISKDEYAYIYKDTSVVKKVGDIYYYNPASKETLKHNIDGIRELMNNYKFKGILFDDYFYPSNDIDINEYENYLKKEKIELEEFHLLSVNKFVKQIHDEIKKNNKDVLFGISPDGNIENNYHKNYADVKRWCHDRSYVDFIMPQLYYGFYNSSKPYIDVMNTWNNLIDDNVNLYYALAFYKVGKEDFYAKEGHNEWIDNNDIIRKQIIVSRNTSHYKGFALFRYDNLFNEELFTENTKSELNNLKSTLKK